MKGALKKTDQSADGSVHIGDTATTTSTTTSKRPPPPVLAQYNSLHYLLYDTKDFVSITKIGTPKHCTCSFWYVLNIKIWGDIRCESILNRSIRFVYYISDISKVGYIINIGSTNLYQWRMLVTIIPSLWIQECNSIRESYDWRWGDDWIASAKYEMDRWERRGDLICRFERKIRYVPYLHTKHECTLFYQFCILIRR